LEEPNQRFFDLQKFPKNWNQRLLKIIIWLPKRSFPSSEKIEVMKM
jgi:hypothetical protein